MSRRTALGMLTIGEACPTCDGFGRVPFMVTRWILCSDCAGGGVVLA